MSNFLSKIESYDYPFTKDIFNKIVDSYINYNNLYERKSLLAAALLDGISRVVYDSIVKLDDKGSLKDNDKRYNYLIKLDSDRKNNPNKKKIKLITGGWIYADCRDNNPKKAEMNLGDVRNRFYICPSREDVFEFSTKLYDKFKEDEVNFLFKTIDSSGRENKKHRRDTIVIYVDDNNIDSTVKSLNEFAWQNEALIRRCHNPSLITMNFNNWLGYAKEEQNEEGLMSYTQRFSFDFEKAIKKFCMDYLKKSNVKLKYTNTDDFLGYFGKTEFDTKSFFEDKFNLDLRLYILSRDLLIKDKGSRDELYKYLINQLSYDGFNMKTFPAHKKDESKVKVKKPNE